MEILSSKEFVTGQDLKELNNQEVIEYILEQTQGKSLHKVQQLAQEVKSRIENAKAEVDYIVTVVPEEDKDIDNSESKISQGASKTLSITADGTYDKPVSLRVCMFQLSESNNLERVTNVLSNLCTYSTSTLFTLCQKYSLNQKLLQILQKYCQGSYGFDLPTSQSGVFQYTYHNLIAKTFCNHHLIEGLCNSDFFDLYGQLIEEALIFAYDYSFRKEGPRG